MCIFDNSEYDNHEQVLFCRDEDAGLFAIIAIHDTTLGPAAGGCRMWSYVSIEDAVTDVLRLAQAMSYKNALADLPLGGGKSVIIGDPNKDKNEKLLIAFARFVQRLGGQYYTAEDVGIGINDVEVLSQASDYVFGLVTTGDPSPFTARGCFEGIRAAVKNKLGRDHLKGLKVAVQGVGNVGRYVCKYLHEAGAKLIVADVKAESATYAVENFEAKAVTPHKIYAQDVDIFSPCAMGGILNDDTIPQLKASIVAGAANNQLAEARHGRLIHNKGILYAPDYVINAGGMLNASGDIFGKYDVTQVMERVTGLYDATLRIFEVAEQENRPTNEVADDLARQKIEAGKALKKS
ncbi:MAG: amino acid dehydrogenase [Deltaproteobacteria bacterium]|nr:amino acid dehydrogenase [Deltaproteobacteria bacterium]MBW2201340.1 amino acid dehydrogenase [Deltaproteobacteria bacterium]